MGSTNELLSIVLSGLYRRPKQLPSKLLYDKEGSELFEQICEQPEYYLTRAELAIMQEFAGEMAELLGPDVLLVEYGSGSGLKTRLLLQHMQRVAAYMPVDISQFALLESLERLRERMPELLVLPLCVDFTEGLRTLPPLATAARTIVFFPGSTIGNLDELEAVRLLRRMHNQMGENGGALIGFDLKKDPSVIEAAYNDAAGITRRFTLNLLERMNRELHANFDTSTFLHQAAYNHGVGRIETRLVSQREQRVRVAEEIIRFGPGEGMLVEISCKYSPEDFAHLARLAGLRIQKSWTDPQDLFCVQYLVPD